MKILITGGLGYIATNLYKFLAYNRPDIICELCDYNMDTPLAHEMNSYFFDSEGYQAVVHLAALSGIMACEENQKKAVQDNIAAAGNIFKLANRYRVPVIFTSSQAVKEPTSSIYAFLKWSCEQLAYNYNDKNGKNYVLRLSNVYGGDSYLDKKQTCVKQFITKYRKGEPLEVHGNGKQERDFIHVLDVCNAIMKVLDVLPADKSPMDIGTGISTSILELQGMFPRKKNHHYKFVDNRDAGAKSSIADISVAKDRIDFVAERKLEDYIKSMIKE